MAAVSDWEVELHREADRILKVWLDNKKRIEILEGEIGELEVNLTGQKNLSAIDKPCLDSYYSLIQDRWPDPIID